MIFPYPMTVWRVNTSKKKLIPVHNYQKMTTGLKHLHHQEHINLHQVVYRVQQVWVQQYPLRALSEALIQDTLSLQVARAQKLFNENKKQIDQSVAEAKVKK